MATTGGFQHSTRNARAFNLCQFMVHCNKNNINNNVCMSVSENKVINKKKNDGNSNGKSNPEDIHILK